MSYFRKLIFLSAVLFLAACDSGAGSEPAGGGESGAAAGAPPPPEVTVAKPFTGPVDEWAEFPGRFEATDTVEIRSRISGYLMKVLFTDGAIVDKGDPLFVIDPRQIEATIRQKEADLALAQSQTTEAANAFNRADSLFKTGDISQAVLDQRRAAMDSANAAVASAKAAVDSAKVDLVYTKINAPITGRISRKLIAEGNLVNPGQDVLTTIVSMDPIYFYFDIDEQTYLDYARQHPDQTKDTLQIPVSIALTDETDFRHTGILDFVDNALDATTGTMRGRAVLENPKMYFTPGMFGRVRIKTGGAEKGVLIPDAAVVIDQSRKMVYVVDDKNMVATRTIETGGIDRGLRVVTKGLDGSERIIINGIQRAHEGAPVTPKEGTVTPAAPQAENAPLAAPDDNVPVDQQLDDNPQEQQEGATPNLQQQSAAQAGSAGQGGTQDAAPAANETEEGKQ